MFTELSPDQRLTKAIVDIMAMPHYTAIHGILMMGKRCVEDGVPTAYTDGKNEKYGREYIESLSDRELRFLALHENFHKMYRHLITWQHLWKENSDLANQACDYVINGKLMKDIRMGVPIEMPKGGLHDPQYDGMNAQQVFDLLKKNGGAQKPKPKGGKGGKGGEATLDQHDWEAAQEMSEEEKNEIAREVDSAVRQGALIAGKLGMGGDLDLADLLQPKVDWRELLRDFVQTTCAGNDLSTWRRPSRRYISAGIYMPSHYSESVGELIIACDMSGSISGDERRYILSEVVGICETVKPARVRLLYWDTKVCGDETYEQNALDQLPGSTKPKGGGGTDVSCVTQYIVNRGLNPQAVIVLTDGYLGGDWGRWNHPVLWCIVNGTSEIPPNGKYVRVDR